MEKLTNSHYTIWYNSERVVALSSSASFYMDGSFFEETTELRDTIPAFWRILDRWKFNQTLLHLLAELQVHDTLEFSLPLEDLLTSLNYI